MSRSRNAAKTFIASENARSSRSCKTRHAPHSEIRSPSHASLTPAEQAETGVTDGLVRLSLGLEETVDLIADIEHALAAANTE